MHESVYSNYKYSISQFLPFCPRLSLFFGCPRLLLLPAYTPHHLIPLLVPLNLLSLIPITCPNEPLPSSPDDRVHGILVQLPLPPHIHEHAVLDQIKQEKDVDGLHPLNVAQLANTKTHGGRAAWSFDAIDFHVSCTPQVWLLVWPLVWLLVCFLECFLVCFLVCFPYATGIAAQLYCVLSRREEREGGGGGFRFQTHVHDDILNVYMCLASIQFVICLFATTDTIMSATYDLDGR